jgi:hypothetical protein
MATKAVQAKSIKGKRLATAKHGVDVTLVITRNDGNEALALCKENDEKVVFARGTQSKARFLNDLPVGREKKCQRFATLQSLADSLAIADKSIAAVTA